MKHRHSIVHYILFILTLAFAVCSGLLLPRVNVNSDMTKYLPDDSPMRQGLQIVSEDFAGDMVSSADVHVMEHAPYDSLLFVQLQDLEPVQTVFYRVSKDSTYTIYDLVVAKSLDQKTFGQKIIAQYPDREIVVETSQDGATPPVRALFIAGAIIVLILLIMTESWLDPIICLLVTGIAVVINMGTNAFLPTVSITTNYIVAILQLVLSLDYCIIFMNRWRQERKTAGTEVLAVNRAMRKAWKPILSSALTTIVGLLMLGFMRLKIGMDLGFVLAKGVVCSLICTLTVLPTVLLLLHNAIIATRKPAPSIPTDGIGRFATNHKVSMAIFGLVMAVGSFCLAQKTEISFSTQGESQIEQVFPKTNPILLVYPTAEEAKILVVADSLNQEYQIQDNQWIIFSYPTILLPQLTANELFRYVKDIASMVPNMSASPNESSYEVIDNAMYNPEMMQMLYYMHSRQADSLQVSFMDLLNFVRFGLMKDPQFANLIDDDMRSQINILNEVLEAALAKEDEVVSITKTPIPLVEAPITPAQPIDPAEVLAHATPKVVEQPVSEPVKEEKKRRRDRDKDLTPAVQPAVNDTPRTVTRTITIIEPADTEHIPVIGFTALINRRYKTAETQYLVNILDTFTMKREMSSAEMGALIGSSKSQTKMVYSMSSSGKTMTPYGYVHFLTDDLFYRPSLQSFVKDSEKAQLNARKNLMDLALTDATISPEQLSDLLALCQIDLTPMDIRTIWSSTSKIYTQEITELIDADGNVESVTSDNNITPVEETQVIPVAAQPTIKPMLSQPRRHRKTKAERQAELFDKLIHSSDTYTADQMVGIFNKLGQKIDSSQVHLLYVAYGSSQGYGDTLTMSPAEVLAYVSDTVVKNEGIAPFLDSAVVMYIDSVSSILLEGLGQIRHDDYSLMAILTDLPEESFETYHFVQRMEELSAELFTAPAYLVGESVMYDEMKEGFDHELHLVTILTILAIFLIVALTFKSIVVPTVLIVTVMTAVYTYATFAGLTQGHMLYLAYLVTQSILMGATIDYGILYTNYYKELRRTLDKYEAAQGAYRGSIRTILTSGSIMVAGPGAMAIFVDDITISAIVSGISIGALISILLILFVLPAVLVAFDRLVVDKKQSV